jgi:hypothetical protein
MLLNAIKNALVNATKCVVVCLAVFAPSCPVNAHGYLAFPAARNVQRNSNYCKHCLNAGGPGVVFARGLPGRHGVCGDPWNGAKDHEAGGRFASPIRTAAVFRAGGTIKAKVVLTSNHGGRWSLRLCPAPSGGGAASERRVVTQRCFNRGVLRRADGRGPYTIVSPNAYKFTVAYRLPKKIRCKRCVLQWTYETGNSCTPRGMRPNAPGMAVCDRSVAGESFWNCADIAIR